MKKENKYNPDRSEAWKYIIQSIASVLNNMPCTPLPENINTDELLYLTNAHGIDCLMSYAITGGTKSEKLIEYYKIKRQNAMLLEAHQEIEIGLVMDELENAKILHMPLKGYEIKNYYPSPEMRSMCDVDLLVENKDLLKAGEILKVLGFDETKDANLHTSYLNPKSHVQVELHKSFVDEELGEMFEYFGSGFERAQKCDGKEYRMKLNDNDFYIFIIAHLAKHFLNCGTGIRSLIDIFVLREKSDKKLNNEYIYSELEKIHLKSFAVTIENLALKLFSGNWDGSFDNVLEYILNSGTYGKLENQVLNRYVRSNPEHDDYAKNKNNFVFKTIFPNLRYMSKRYKILCKLPFLLPIFWIVRLIYTLFKSKKSINYRLGGVTASDDSVINVYKESGIYEYGNYMK